MAEDGIVEVGAFPELGNRPLRRLLEERLIDLGRETKETLEAVASTPWRSATSRLMW